jgi:leader peptidase (prepilin peptidase) / N-methyltransferase
VAAAAGQTAVSILTAVVVGLFGLVIGSFLNVVIYRLPRNESLNWPGSHCTACNRPLSWYENLPLLSWLALGGRCRSCRASISPMYPLVELVTGAIFVAGYVVYGVTPLLFVRLAFACALIALFGIDLRHQILPNRITLPGLAVGLVCSLFLPPGWQSAGAGALFGGVFPWLIAEAYLRLRGREGMGMGDFKMLAMAGAFLGWPLIYLVIMLACLLGVVIGGGALLVTRRGAGTRLPFGTFIALAAVIAIFAGPQMMARYEGWLDAYVRWAGL